MKGKRKILRYFVLFFCDLLKIIMGFICYIGVSFFVFVVFDRFNEKSVSEDELVVVLFLFCFLVFLILL